MEILYNGNEEKLIMEPITVIAEGHCCECCIAWLANADDSSCRDYNGHEPHYPNLPGGISEGQLIPGGSEGDLTDSEVIVGPCDLCGAGESGYMEGYPYAVLSR